jgi:hypothetical protein
MSPILLAYLANIVILIPIGPLTLLGGPNGARRVFQAKFGESEGIRTILGSLWTAILLCSVLGVFLPVEMSPMLLIQVLYKLLWLVVFAAPRLLAGRMGELPMGIVLTFAVIVLAYPWVIPWSHFLGRLPTIPAG